MNRTMVPASPSTFPFATRLVTGASTGQSLGLSEDAPPHPKSRRAMFIAPIQLPQQCFDPVQSSFKVSKLRGVCRILR